MTSQRESRSARRITGTSAAPVTANSHIASCSADGIPNSAVEVLQHDDAESVASDLSTDSYYVGFKEDLLGALESIQTSGSFASFRGLSRPPPAGLFVHGIGGITMPLGESQARQLIAKGRQAPYGKGSDTIVDTSVRNTWELDAEQFIFRDPSWPGFLQTLCSCVAMDLGINATITAEIYKMLIYEKGAMFKAHTDTEKIPGMFGTLVICLPSVHQGGEVVVKHCGEKRVFKTSEATQSFACWYSDVSHEVLPVTSGYRWVLTYNLAVDLTQEYLSASLQWSETRVLRHTLRRWLEDEASREMSCVYHVLDHDYTETNISLQALKTRDLAQVQVLKEISGELPVEIFLALLEKEEKGSCEYNWDRGSRRGRYSRYNYYGNDDDDKDESGYHPLAEVFQKSYRVKTLVDLEGDMVMQGLVLDKDSILQENCFEDLEAEEEYQGFMGNSGPSATHWYRVTAVVIVPHDSVINFFRSHDVSSFYLPPSKNLQSLIRYFIGACLRPQAAESSVTALIQLCNQAWHNNNRTSYGGISEPPMDGESIRGVLKIAVQLGQSPFFEQAAFRHQGLLPLDFFIWIRQWLYGSGDDAGEHFNAIQKGMSAAVSSYPWFANQSKAIANFAPIHNGVLALDVAICISDRILDWARRTICSCLDACMSRDLGKEDGAAMVDLVPYFTDSSTFLLKIVAPRIQRRSDAGAFFLGFLAQLQQQGTKGILAIDNFVQLYRTMAKSFIIVTDFMQVYGEAEDKTTAAKRPCYTSELPQRDDSRTAISHKVLADFFSTIIELNTEADDLLTLLVARLVTAAPLLPARELHGLWLPFLRSLIPILASNNIPLSTPCYQQLFSVFLRAYVDKYVGYEPPEDQNLVRPSVRCFCSDCRSLNAFLTNGPQMVGYFTMGRQRRAHLHQKLDFSGIACTHQTRRSSSPQTLVVTKTLHGNEAARWNWNLRLAQAKKQLQQFEQGHLRLLLGADYRTVVDMEHLSAEQPARLPVATQQTPPTNLAPVSTNQPRGSLQGPSSGRLSRPSVTGVKRKRPPPEAEIIDLTSD